jgi:peptide/nickel transport system substrate-binding protein
MEEKNYWQRVSRRRVSRRGLLAAGGTAALGGAAAMVVGCGGGGNGGSDPGSTRGPVGSPTPGGSVTFGRLLAAGGVDPHIDLTGFDIDMLVYSRLYDWDEINEEIIINNLAENFEHPDDLTFIFTLRRGVMTHPGDYPGANEEITSLDVKQSFIRRSTSLTAIDKRFPYKIAGSTDPAMIGPALKTPDSYTFSFVMADPFVPAIREIANFWWAIVPAKVIEEFGLGLSQEAYGSGPFMLESFRGHERIVLRKHPNYFHQGRPYLDEMDYIIITEASSLRAAFESGAHDVNGSVLTKDDYDELKDDSRFTVARAPTLFYPSILYKWRPPFDDIRVREAINLALDRDDFINTLISGEGQYNGPIQWPQRKWALPQDELRGFYRFDLDRARELMAEAGYADGFDVQLKIPELSGAPIVADSASLIKSQLEAIKINANIQEIELGTYIVSTILPGNFQMAFTPIPPLDEPDRPLSFFHSRGVSGTGNPTNYTNPTLDKLLDKQSEQFVESERQATIWEAQRMILKEHGPVITLPSGYQYSARWSHVHFPFEIGQAPPDGVLPFGADIWSEQA